MILRNRKLRGFAYGLRENSGVLGLPDRYEPCGSVLHGLCTIFDTTYRRESSCIVSKSCSPFRRRISPQTTSNCSPTNIGSFTNDTPWWVKCRFGKKITSSLSSGWWWRETNESIWLAGWKFTGNKYNMIFFDCIVSSRHTTILFRLFWTKWMLELRHEWIIFLHSHSVDAIWQKMSRWTREMINKMNIYSIQYSVGAVCIFTCLVVRQFSHII